MSFDIRFYIGNRLGRASRYSLIEFCVHCVDRMGLKEHETATVVTLQVGESFDIPRIMNVRRVT